MLTTLGIRHGYARGIMAYGTCRVVVMLNVVRCCYIVSVVTLFDGITFELHTKSCSRQSFNVNDRQGT